MPDSFAARASQIFGQHLTVSASAAYVNDPEGLPQLIPHVWRLSASAYTQHEVRHWGRLEVLQRTPAELEIPSFSPNSGEWVSALTLGATRRVASLWGFDFSAGLSGTLDVVPTDFAATYGGSVVFAGKVFVEARFIRGFAVGI